MSKSKTTSPSTHIATPITLSAREAEERLWAAQEIKRAAANKRAWNRLVREVESLMDNSSRCNGSKPTRVEAERTLAVISDFFMRWVDQRGSTAYALELISRIIEVNVPDGVQR